MVKFAPLTENKTITVFWIFLRDMLQLVMSSRHGWEDIAYDDSNPHRLLVYGLIPWLLLTSATSLIPIFLGGNLAVIPVLHALVSTFLMFFISYYIGVSVFSFYMPSFTHGESIESHNNTLLVYSVGLLATIEIIKNCMPVALAMLNFFPLYVLYIMWQGYRYLKVGHIEHVRYVAMSFLAVIVPPYILQYLFTLILP